ncbi:MAG: radical SAM protein [Sedimentisphaerales bacterium]|nr:radical SAM protein [Sedimentisphaerales bacterium]
MESIYPIEIPDIELRPNQDLILLDLPARISAMMPNGLGYVHNILKKTGIRFQTVDLDVIFYHLYHSRRILNKPDKVLTPDGYVMREDPWEAIGIEEEWRRPEVMEYFRQEIDATVAGLVQARPKILGISLHSTNLLIAKHIVEAVRARYPEVIVLVGGYDCVDHIRGPQRFSGYDYMVIREAEITLPGLVRALAAGEKPKDLPGVISRYDSPGRIWEPGPVPEDLDSIDFPQYDWAGLDLYRRWNGQRLTPILASRGCSWSRCRFCCEWCMYRKRSAEKVVDELQWLVEQGSDVFQFNDSDVNGDPDYLIEICKDIIRRGLKVKLTGQLRINKRGTREFYDCLKKAGFSRLRFGVDGWTDHTLRLERKGYTTDIVNQNLRSCREAGIYIAVNSVVGIPGETDEDIEETIANILKNKDYIGLVESVRTLMLVAGSEYYQNPEKYNIRFRGDKENLYAENPIHIPDHLWYSVDPYIDEEVKSQRWQRVCSAVSAGGVTVGPYIKWRAKDTGGNAADLIIKRTGSPLLVEEGYRQFNIISCNGKLYGLAQSEGRLNLDKVDTDGYRCVVAESVEEVKRLIDRQTPADEKRTLIEEGYRGHNIISVGAKLYGLAQSEGKLDLGRVNMEGYRCVAGNSVNEVKRSIDRCVAEKSK